jgi:DNA-binding CsgD family transcriptional regulator
MVMNASLVTRIFIWWLNGRSVALLTSPNWIFPIGSELRATTNRAESSVPTDFLQRISVATRYAVGARDLPLMFSFFYENVFDVLSPKSATLWSIDANGSWQLSASAGESLALPVGFATWKALNQFSTQAQRVGSSAGTQTKNAVTSHWAAPCLIPGRTYHVLHLNFPESGLSQESIVAFLDTVSHLFLFPLDENLAQGHGIKGVGGGSHEALTPRQSKILDLIKKDLTYQQIASRLGFSESTISKEAMQIFRKLGVSNRVAAAEGGKEL